MHQDVFSNETQIAIFKTDERGIRYICEPMTMVFKEINEGACIIEPTLKLSRIIANQFLQELSNALNVAGYRSTTVEGYKSEIASIKYHLEDMRKIVFK